MSKISVNKTNINKIKRLLLMLLVCTVMGGLFLGCGSNNTENNDSIEDSKEDSSDDCDFVKIKDVKIEGSSYRSRLYYDKKTKIVYLEYRKTYNYDVVGFYVLYNTSGTPMTIDEYDSYED